MFFTIVSEILMVEDYLEIELERVNSTLQEQQTSLLDKKPNSELQQKTLRFHMNADSEDRKASHKTRKDQLLTDY